MCVGTTSIQASGSLLVICIKHLEDESQPSCSLREHSRVELTVMTIYIMLLCTVCH